MSRRENFRRVFSLPPRPRLRLDGRAWAPGSNLLASIFIYWKTAHLADAVAQAKDAGLPVEPELLPHISPLGWAHILLTGEYRWPKRRQSCSARRLGRALRA